MEPSKLETLIDLIYNGNTAAANACRDLVSPDLVPQLLLIYRYLKDWRAKERCILLLQDQEDKGMKAAMLDFLQAPMIKGDEQREISKAIALGFMGEAYNRPKAYFYDKQLLYNDINEVLVAHNLSPLSTKEIGPEEEKIIKHNFQGQ